MKGEDYDRLRDLCCLGNFLHELGEVQRDGELERVGVRTWMRNETVAARRGGIRGEPEVADHLAGLFGKIEG